MAWTREAADACDRIFQGYAQEYLDHVHKLSDEYRAAVYPRGVQPVWEPVSSDSDYSSDRAPLSPPASPRGEGPDLSRTAWDRRKWSDLSQGIETRDSGFDSYQKWRSQMMAEHASKVLPTLSSLEKPDVRKKQRRPAVIVSERLVQIDL